MIQKLACRDPSQCLTCPRLPPALAELKGLHRGPEHPCGLCQGLGFCEQGGPALSGASESKHSGPMPITSASLL